MSSSIQVLPNQVSKKYFYTFEYIDLQESHSKLHKQQSETLGLYFAQCSFTEMKSKFINLQNESLLKDIGKQILIVNNSVYHAPFSS